MSTPTAPTDADPNLRDLRIPRVWAKRALTAMVQYGTHEEFDSPGDTPESCGWWCDLCKQHIDDADRSQGHAISCVIEIFRNRITNG